MLTAIQTVLLVFVIFFLSRVYLRSKEKVISAKTALFWTIVWILALVGILLPATTTKVATFFGVGRGVDVIVYLALSVLFYLVFRIYVMIEDLRRDLTKIVRDIATENIYKKTPSSPKNSKKTSK